MGVYIPETQIKYARLLVFYHFIGLQWNTQFDCQETIQCELSLKSCVDNIYIEVRLSRKSMYRESTLFFF